MDILIPRLEVIITDYAEATERSPMNGGVDDAICLPTALSLSVCHWLFSVSGNKYVLCWTLFPMVIFRGSERIFPAQTNR